MMLVPIYSANITLNRISVTGPNKKKQKFLDKIILSNQVVKGFSLIDIKKRKNNNLAYRANKIKKLGKDQFYKVVEIELLKQHGYGVND